MRAPPSLLRVLIVDDEPLARDCIRLALQPAAEVEIVGECGNGEEAVRAIGELEPDLVFLDVQMPELDGFGVIERVGTGAMPPVVFVTAYDEHAVHAFEVHALDYVLKPFDDARLREAFDHARLVMMDRRHGELGRRLAEVLRHWERAALAANGDAPDAPAGDAEAPDALDQAAASVGPRESSLITRFSVRTDGRVKFIPAAAVDWIEADRNYIVLCVGDAKHKVRGSLRDVITRLDRRTFARIHKSAIVNIDRIRELQPWFGGDYIAILRNGAKLKVSRRHVAALIRPMA